MTYRNLHRISVCLPPTILYRCSLLYTNKFYHNFSTQNNSAHVKVIPRLCVSYSNENKLSRQQVRHYSKTVHETTENVSSVTAKGL